MGGEQGMRLSRDIVSGSATIALAAGILLALARIPQTSYQAIAPDLFPRICAWALILTGLILIGRGVFRGGEQASLPPLRVLAAVLGSVIAFGALAPRIGYAPAGLLTLVIGGLGSPDVKPGQLLLFSLVLTVFSVLLFSALLKLSIPVVSLFGISF